jgi:uncharacterized protein (DUF2235 family)
MPKNLVVCLDGTNNEFGVENTNVVRLFQALVDDPVRQLRHYDPGVGTIGHPGVLTRSMDKLTKILGMGFGLGVTQNVIDSYRFLMDHYANEDRIFIFGFSRGSLEARALAGLLHRCGLLRPELETLAPYAVRVFQTLENDAVPAEFKETFSRPVEIHFLGLWDTVTSFGNVWSPIAWPNTTNNPGVRIVRHAVALDERRAFFRQNRWARGDATPRQDVKERWFVGVHCDVGGGYRRNESALWTVTLEWMAAEALGRELLIDMSKLNGAITETRKLCHDPNGWRSIVHDSMKGVWPLWYITELVPKQRWIGKTAEGDDRYEWMWPIGHWFAPWLLGRGSMGRARSIGRARELRPGDHLHRSVLERFAADPKYRPDSLLRIGLTAEQAQRFLATGEESFVADGSSRV